MRTGIASAMSVAALALCVPKAADADIVYTYTGNPLTHTTTNGVIGQSVKAVITYDDSAATGGLPKSVVMSYNGTTISNKDQGVTGNTIIQYYDPATGSIYPGAPVRLWNLMLVNPSGFEIATTANALWVNEDDYVQINVSSGNVGADNTDSPGTWVITKTTPPVIPTTPPPTVLQLAQLSKDVYATTASGIDGYTPSPLNTSDSYGMKANAYVSPDSTQVVIAFRGTYTDTRPSLIKNLTADASFFDSVPSQFITGAVPDAVGFLQQVKQSYPNANITLTGHSLGGALAQMIGAEANMSTSAFNAPGSLDVFSKITPQLSPAQGLGSGGTNTNYRVYGDQISLIGSQLGSVVVLPKPTDVTFIPTSSLTTDEGKVIGFIANFDGLTRVHNIDAVISDIQTNGTNSVLTTDEPNYVTVLKNAYFPQTTTIDSVTNVIKLEFALEIATGAAQVSRIFDPTTGAKFTFTTSNSSPDIECITPPALDGVASYNVRAQTGSQWSSFQAIQPGAQTCFGNGVKSIEFDPIDQSGKSVTISDQFFFAAKFSAAGKVSATLTEEPVADFSNPTGGTSDSESKRHHGGGGCSAFAGTLDGKGSDPAPFDPTLIFLAPAAWLLRKFKKQIPVANDNAVTATRPSRLLGQKTSIPKADV